MQINVILLVIGQRCDNPVAVKIGNAEVVKSFEEKLVGAHIDSKLSNDHHVSKICQKASNKLDALACISPYMDHNKLRILMMRIYYQSISILPFSLNVSQQTGESKNQQNTGKGTENYI